MSNLPANDAEARVYKALVAYKIESGMAKAAAETWAQPRTAAGTAVWKKAFNENGDRDEGALMAAYAALKTWARAQ